MLLHFLCTQRSRERCGQNIKFYEHNRVYPVTHKTKCIARFCFWNSWNLKLSPRLFYKTLHNSASKMIRFELQIAWLDFCRADQWWTWWDHVPNARSTFGCRQSQLIHCSEFFCCGDMKKIIIMKCARHPSEKSWLWLFFSTIVRICLKFFLDLLSYTFVTVPNVRIS